MIDEPIARNGMQPDREGTIGLIGRAARVDSKEGLLHQVVGIGGPGRSEPLLEIAPEEARRRVEQPAIGRRIPGERVHDPSVQLGFARNQCLS